MTLPWRLETLGRLRVVSGSQIIEKFASQKAGALLAYLALHADRTHPREELIERLWPDSDPSTKRTRLNHFLWSLRQQLEPPGTARGAVLQTDRLSVRLNPEGLKTDVEEFRQLLTDTPEEPVETTIERYRQAIEIYKGDFLLGMHDEWIYILRQQLADQRISLFKRLGTLLCKAGKVDEAIETLKLLVASEPLDEGAHCSLMQLYLETGNHTLVSKQYAELERILATELREEPSSEAKSILETAKKAKSTSNGSGEYRTPIEVRPDLSGYEKPQAPTQFSSERTASRSIPTPLTRFFGRIDEIDQVFETFNSGVRLLTLTGLGGSGKTRLGVEIATRWYDEVSESVWFVPLVDITNPQLIPDAILQAMGIARTQDVAPMDQTKRTLRAQRNSKCLLVLDNFEQLAEDGARIVQELLQSIPKLHCLITSRQRLTLAGEFELSIKPLPLMKTDSLNLEQAAVCPSIALFVDRAQAARPYFQINARNAKQIAMLCKKLEGIPLALELAASWAHLLGPVQMLEQLTQRFDLLVAKGKGLAPRHRSLHAVVQTSYEHLDPSLQELFKKLSIFRGGFSVQAAANLALDSGYDIEALDQLSHLRNRSLIVEQPERITEHISDVRFHMLETLQEFASEQLTEEETTALRHKHLNYYVNLTEEHSQLLTGEEQQESIAILLAEQENLYAALEWALATQKVEDGLKLCGNLRRFWIGRGYFAEARSWIERLLALDTSHVSLRTLARAYQSLCMMLYKFDEYDLAEENAKRAIDLYQQIDDISGVAASLNDLSLVYLNRSLYDQCKAYIEESVQLLRQTKDEYLLARSLLNLGVVYSRQNKHQLSQRHTNEAFMLFCKLGDTTNRALAISNLGYEAYREGDLDQARRLLEEGIKIYRSVESREGILNSLLILAHVAYLQKRFQDTREHLAESVRTYHDLGQIPFVWQCLFSMGKLMVREGNLTGAAHLIESAKVIVDFYLTLPSYLEEGYKQERQALQQKLGQEQYDAILAALQGRSVEELIDDVLDQVTMPHAKAS